MCALGGSFSFSRGGRYGCSRVACHVSHAVCFRFNSGSSLFRGFARFRYFLLFCAYCGFRGSSPFEFRRPKGGLSGWGDPKVRRCPKARVAVVVSTMPPTLGLDLRVSGLVPIWTEFRSLRMACTPHTTLLRLFERPTPGYSLGPLHYPTLSINSTGFLSISIGRDLILYLFLIRRFDLLGLIFGVDARFFSFRRILFGLSRVLTFRRGGVFSACQFYMLSLVSP